MASHDHAMQSSRYERGELSTACAHSELGPVWPRKFERPAITEGPLCRPALLQGGTAQRLKNRFPPALLQYSTASLALQQDGRETKETEEVQLKQRFGERPAGPLQHLPPTLPVTSAGHSLAAVAPKARIDDLTEVPEDLFLALVDLGRKARRRGQHMLRKGPGVCGRRRLVRQDILASTGESEASGPATSAAQKPLLPILLRSACNKASPAERCLKPMQRSPESEEGLVGPVGRPSLSSYSQRLRTDFSSSSLLARC